jgi:cobalt-zinc-cadmium efflux system membrane fusion protein
MQTAPEPVAIVRDGQRIKIPDGSPFRARLQIDAVKVETVTDRLVVPATVEPDPATSAKITPPVPGRVVKVFVHPGDTVNKGQPLFTLDAPDLVQAQSDFLHAQTVLAQAKRTFDRQKDLKDHGVGSEREVEQAKAELDTAQAEQDRAATRLKLLKSDPGQLGKPLTVFAPLPGRIVDFSVATGEYRNDTNAVLMTIADLSTVWVTANVQEKDVARVSKGQAASSTFTAYPGETFAGKVLFVADVLDPDTRTLKARIAFPNDRLRIKPGMFATVMFEGVASEALVVPATAIVLDGERSVVFVEVAPWELEEHTIVTGATHDGRVVVTSGLTAGARIVTKDAVLLQ